MPTEKSATQAVCVTYKCILVHSPVWQFFVSFTPSDYQARCHYFHTISKWYERIKKNPSWTFSTYFFKKMQSPNLVIIQSWSNQQRLTVFKDRKKAKSTPHWSSQELHCSQRCCTIPWPAVPYNFGGVLKTLRTEKTFWRDTHLIQ